MKIKPIINTVIRLRAGARGFVRGLKEQLAMPDELSLSSVVRGAVRAAKRFPPDVISDPADLLVNAARRLLDEEDPRNRFQAVRYAGRWLVRGPQDDAVTVTFDSSVYDEDAKERAMEYLAWMNKRHDAAVAVAANATRRVRASAS